jgi:phospholipid-binding lipoprotein MlaA
VRKILLGFLTFFLSMMLLACSTTTSNSTTQISSTSDNADSSMQTSTNPYESPNDPFEHFNRDTYRFNDKMDKAIIKPIARGYVKITPAPVRQSVSNFMDNLDGILTISNDILQGDGDWAFSDTWRFMINSTVGILGLFDPASHIGLMPHDNDFGLTLERWGWHSPYLIVPFAGPRTLGGVIAMPINGVMNMNSLVFTLDQRVMLLAIYGLNARAQILASEDLSSGMVFDPYIFMRDAYMQDLQYEVSINAAGPQFSQE